MYLFTRVKCEFAINLFSVFYYEIDYRRTWIYRCLINWYARLRSIDHFKLFFEKESSLLASVRSSICSY